MNNELNKPVELTEKELAGVVGGDVDLVTMTVKEVERVAERGKVERGKVERGNVEKTFDLPLSACR